MVTLLAQADEESRSRFLQQFIDLLYGEGRSDAMVFILLDTVLEIDQEYLQPDGYHRFAVIRTFIYKY